jgi:hypothetical protein
LLLASTKYEMAEDDKAMFHGFDTPCDRIVCLLADPKCDLDEVEDAMI